MGGKTCAIDSTRYNHTYLECLLPPGETLFNTVLLTVEGRGVQRAQLPLPSARHFVHQSSDGASTQGNDLLSIVGYNFGFSTATVAIGGAACTVQTLNNTLITCLSPAGVGVQQPVYVTTNLQRNLQAFYWSYAPPTVLRVSPASYDSLGGAVLTVAGTSFGASAAVTYVNGQLCPSVTGNDTLITCTLPGGQGFNLNVTVVQTGQTSTVTSLSLFSYLPPNITDPPSPPGAQSGSGVYLLLTGRSFGVSGLVTVNGLVCDWTSGGSWGHHAILCLLPSGSGSSVPVQICGRRPDVQQRVLHLLPLPVSGRRPLPPHAGRHSADHPRHGLLPPLPVQRLRHHQRSAAVCGAGAERDDHRLCTAPRPGRRQQCGRAGSAQPV